MEIKSKSAPILSQLSGESELSGLVLQLGISENHVEIMRSGDGRRVNFFDVLKMFEIAFATVNPSGVLVFLQDLKVAIETKPGLTNETTGEDYTILTVSNGEGEALFSLGYDPFHDDMSKYFVTDVRGLKREKHTPVYDELEEILFL